MKNRIFNNKTLLVTGGTGSFGKMFIETILKTSKPKKIIVYSRDELKQFEMSQKLNQSCMRYFIGDVRDYERLKTATKGVNFLIHAAAMKHVEASEYNPIECVKTNIHGAENIINASIINNIEKVIALSTDKAVNPINLYGATKLVSDKLFIAGNNIVGNNKTKFSVARYGNVAGSRGSVLILFKKLIKENPNFIPITDNNMTRFWINLKDGVSFVIKNFQRMRGGEIFIPKIPSIYIKDLAKAIAPNIKQKIIGTKPGEKINEILCSSDESSQTIEFKEYYLIKPSIVFSNRKNNYLIDKAGNKGKYVPKGFEYSSHKNSKVLSISQIRKLNSINE